MKHKIYVWCNTNCDKNCDWHNIIAIAEDGNVLAGHVCSHHCFIEHDMGITSNWKHEEYDKHYGKDNWKLEYVEQKDIATNVELQKALKLNQKIRIKEELERDGIGE